MRTYIIIYARILPIIRVCVYVPYYIGRYVKLMLITI
uniref:Uncharacterized protein n=1 Tax=CrAss-like virus sp. ctUXy6 TaxID=2825835 RepID=A0A8S5V7N6_9CAUD|nr:MAG TPA: hypothetical protein [CrAss-like virus sp. ctUXy6]